MNRDINLNTFEDVNKALLPYVPLVSQLTGKDTVLDRIKPLMAYLGNPESKFKTIHIAGTSGKTSTSYYISKLLTYSKFRIGLTVSPHIDNLNERVQINGSNLAEDIFCSKMEQFLTLIKRSGIKPSYFELMYAFSIWVFSELKVDYAVIETGMGGLFDATNIVDRKDKICVITDIGFDHMNILGNTIEEITRQKVGIVHKGNNLLMYKQSDQIMGEVFSWLEKVGAIIQLTTEKDEQPYAVGKNYIKLPDYQKRNWLLAYFVYRFISLRDSLSDLNIDQLNSSQLIKIPARMDEVRQGDKNIIMDGAHNYQKMESFISSYKNKYFDCRPNILLSFKNGKDFIVTLPIITEIADKIIITTFKSTQDLPARSVSPNKVANELTRIGFTNYLIEPSISKAFEILKKEQNKDIVVTGSFYLISQFRKEVLNK